MKKIAISIILLVSLIGCNTTSTSQNTQMLQKHYQTVYKITPSRYVTVDSTGTIYDVTVTLNGGISSIVRIK